MAHAPWPVPPAACAADPAKDTEVLGGLMTLLRELNARYAAASPEGPFFFGSNISVVDLAVVPILARFSIALALYRGFQPLREVRQGCVCVRFESPLLARGSPPSAAG